MCRSLKTDGVHRRCNCDTSEKRMARKRNAEILGSIESGVSKNGEPVESVFNPINSVLDQDARVKFISNAEEQNQPVDLSLVEQSDQDFYANHTSEEIIAHIKSLKDRSERINAYRCAQSIESLRDIPVNDMVSLERIDDVEKAELVSKKRMLRICEIQEQVSELKGEGESMNNETCEKVLPLIRESGAIISAEGSYASGLYVGELKQEFERKKQELLDGSFADYVTDTHKRVQGMIASEVKKGDVEVGDIGLSLHGMEQRARIIHQLYPENETLNKCIEMLDECNRVKKELAARDEWALEKTQSINGACMDVIKRTQPFGLEKDPLRYNKKTTSKAAKQLKEAVGFFPHRWCERINDYDLWVKESKKRAKYSHTSSRTLKVGNSFIVSNYRMTKRIEDKSIDLSAKPEEILNPDEMVAYAPFKPGTNEHIAVMCATSRLRGKEEADKIAKKEVWLLVECDLFESSSPEVKEFLKGQGRTLEETYVNENGEKEKYYYSPSVVKAKQVISAAVLSTRKEGSDFYKRSTILHELSHRVECSFPVIGRLERAFYEDRTAGEKYVKYNGRAEELVKTDNFVNVYMGKDYGKAHEESRDTNFEILSTGAESVYGRFGGLIGLDKSYKKGDQDMRNFILGIFSNA